MLDKNTGYGQLVELKHVIYTNFRSLVQTLTIQFYLHLKRSPFILKDPSKERIVIIDCVGVGSIRIRIHTLTKCNESTKNVYLPFWRF